MSDCCTSPPGWRSLPTQEQTGSGPLPPNSPELRPLSADSQLSLSFPVGAAALPSLASGGSVFRGTAGKKGGCSAPCRQGMVLAICQVGEVKGDSTPKQRESPQWPPLPCLPPRLNWPLRTLLQASR